LYNKGKNVAGLSRNDVGPGRVGLGNEILARAEL